MIEKLNYFEKELNHGLAIQDLVDKINEIISIVNKISSLERLEKDLKELGEEFDKVECRHEWIGDEERGFYCKICGVVKH